MPTVFRPAMLIVAVALALFAAVASGNDGIVPANGEGFIVAIDVNRDHSTSRNPHNLPDKRVGGAEIRLTFQSGITQTVTADEWGVAAVQTNGVVNAVVICPPMWDHVTPWQCSASDFFQRDTWTFLPVSPRVVWLPVGMKPW